MTDDEAREIVGWLAGAYDPSEDALILYRRALKEWDATIVSAVVIDWIRRERFMPRLSEIRDLIQTKRKLAEADLWRRALPEPTRRPEWVSRWEEARKAGDDRLLVEQLPGVRQNHAAALADCSLGVSGYEAMLEPVSLVTVSTQRRRVYERKFDHEDAQRRFAAGVSVGELAAEYGVSYTAVSRVVRPLERERMARNSRRFLMSGTCQVCGKEGVARKNNRCKDCADLANASSVGVDVLRCSSCRRWLPDDQFQKGGNPGRHKLRRGKRQRCRSCESMARRLYRHRQMVPCASCGQPTTPADSVERRANHAVPYCPACIPRGGDTMAEPTFIVLVEEEPGLWREVADCAAKDRRDALAQAFDGKVPGERVVVVSLQAFRPGHVVPVQVLDLEPAES